MYLFPFVNTHRSSLSRSKLASIVSRGEKRSGTQAVIVTQFPVVISITV